MADLEPFRAVRYSGAAGPLDELVAPPYDAVSPDERDRLFTRSPYNVAHLTLPESPDEAAVLYRSWLDEGILTREEEPAAWLLVEDYVGPDGTAQVRRGIVGSLAAEPYGAGAVLPHERTRSEVRDDRVRLLRATGVQPEPIFLLVDEPLQLDIPERPPDLGVDGSRLWRLGEVDVQPNDRAGFLIADGHHRYESALELGAGARVMALVVSTTDPGLSVFATHRLFAGRPDLAGLGEGRRLSDLDDALAALAAAPPGGSAAVAYETGHAELLEGREDELDVELVDRYGLEGISYTPNLDDAVAAVDRGDADVAFLLRPPRIEDVFAVARRGERLPPKSTYFFPKPMSGLLFHPLEP
jgi:uncharacterized protein (DUF1015 family)